MSDKQMLQDLLVVSDCLPPWSKGALPYSALAELENMELITIHDILPTGGGGTGIIATLTGKGQYELTRLKARAGRMQ